MRALVGFEARAHGREGEQDEASGHTGPASSHGVVPEQNGHQPDGRRDRQGQLLRLVTLLSVLNRYAGSSLRGRVGLYLFSSVTLIVFVAAVAVLDAERGGPGTIQSFGDALWWAMTTITTVGYGDTYPVTTTGRFIAVGLMFSGIAVLGVVTASFASWLVERVSEADEESEAATRRDIASLHDEIRQLREDLTSR